MKVLTEQGYHIHIFRLIFAPFRVSVDSLIRPAASRMMPFQRKGTVIGSSCRPQPKLLNHRSDEEVPPGVRPSPLDGRPTVSTGTVSLDRFFGGHSGLPLGTSVLVEETGATDFAGVLARYYAAEGLVQGHHVHVLGQGDGWKADLPGLSKSGGPPPSQQSKGADEMKIAWRYERLNNGTTGERGLSTTCAPPAKPFS